MYPILQPQFVHICDFSYFLSILSKLLHQNSMCSINYLLMLFDWIPFFNPEVNFKNQNFTKYYTIIIVNGKSNLNLIIKQNQAQTLSHSYRRQNFNLLFAQVIHICKENYIVRTWFKTCL